MRLALSLLMCSLALANPASAEEEENPAAGIRELLEAKRASVNFEGAQVEEIAEFLREVTKLNVLVDPQIPPEVKVTVQMRQAPLNTILELVATVFGLETRVWCGVLYLAEEGRELGARPQADGELGEKLEQKLTTSFNQTSYGKFLSHLKEKSGIRFAVSLPARALIKEQQVKVSGRLKELSVSELLCLFSLPYGLTWRAEDGGILIDVQAD